MRNHRYLWALAAALLASCADYSVPDSVLYGAAVYTQPAPGFSPAGKNLTYYLNPTYREVDGETITDVPLDSVPTVRDAIVTQMEDVYGYAPGTPPPDLVTPPGADVVLNVTVLKGNVSVYYPGYWCDYWYYYSCYYNWYYAGSYNVGTLVVEMGDLTSATGGCIADRTCTLPIFWTGVVYGVVTTTWNDQTRAVEGINRAFGQSTYLKTN